MTSWFKRRIGVRGNKKDRLVEKSLGHSELLRKMHMKKKSVRNGCGLQTVKGLRTFLVIR